jgi:hypothetical protein
MVRLPRRGTLRRVSATGDDSPRTFGSDDLRVAVWSRGRSKGVRNVVNPMVGCGVQQTRGPSNERIFGSDRCGGNRWSREERQERSTFGTWQSRTEVQATAWTGCGRRTVVSAEGRSMNPKRGVRDVEVDLRIGWDRADRANRVASEQDGHRCLDPMRSIYGGGGKGQRTTPHEVSVTTCHGLDLGVRSLSSASVRTSRGGVSP